MGSNIEDLTPEELLRESAWLNGLAKQLVTDPQRAEDVAQDAWLALARHRGRISQLRPWLRRVTRNFASRLGARESQRSDREERAARAEALPSAAESVERVRLQHCVVAALLELPEPYRSTVVLRFFEDLPPRKIADRMAVPVETVRTRLQRALARMRRELDREFSDRRAWAVPLASYLGTTQTVAAALLAVLIMKAKTIAVAAALLAGIVVLWSVWGVPSSELPSDTATTPPALLGADFPLTDTVSESPVDELQREAVPTRPIGVATRGTLSLQVLWGDDREPAADLLLTVSPLGEDFRIVGRRERTDGRGIARLEGLTEGAFIVDVERNIRASARAEVRAGEDTELEILLPVGINITGIVVDRDGVPVPNAEVHLGAPAIINRDAEHVTNTGEGGRFTIRAAGTLSLVGARAADHAPSKMYFLNGNEGDTLDVRLEFPGPGGVVDGIVLGPMSLPVADAVVRIGEGRLDRIRATSNGALPLPAQVRTDESGRFRAVGIPPGQHPVSVRAAGLAPWTGPIQVPANVTASLQVFLGDGVVWHGTVRDRDAIPVGAVSLTVGERGGLASYRTQSLADGTFRLEGLPTGEIELVAKHDEHGKASAKVGGASGETLQRDLSLSRGVALRGRVVTEDGEPVARALVHVYSDDPSNRFSMSLSTDTEGRFTLTNCPEDQLLRVTAEGRNIEDLERTGVDPRAGEVMLRARRAPVPSAHIVGTVFAPDGKPLGHARVTAFQIGGRTQQTRTTDEGTGSFELGPLRPGTYYLTISALEFPGFRSEEREVVADTTWEMGEVQLRQGGTVRVRVHGDAPSTRFGLYDSNGQFVTSVYSDAQEYGSQLVVPGRYQVLVSGTEIAAQLLPVTVRIGEEIVVGVRPERGFARRFEFHTDGVIRDGRTFRLRITRGSETVRYWSTTRFGDNPLTREWWFAPGQYTITAEGEGLGGSTNFTVTGAATHDVIRVELR